MNATDSLILSPMDKLERAFYAPDTLARFENILGPEAKPYVESVLLLAAQRQDIQKCTLQSILTAAITAATLRLSCNPVLKQAHLIPILRRKKDGNNWNTWYEAVFYPHYLGLYLLAIRSGVYQALDIYPTPPGVHLVYDTEKCRELLLDQNGNEYTRLSRNIPQVGGWYAFFTTRDGFTRQIHMTLAEIHQRARTKNPSGYNAKGSQWQDAQGKGVMEMKSVLRDLLNWADKNGMSSLQLHTALGRLDVIDVESDEVLPSGVAHGVDKAFP